MVLLCALWKDSQLRLKPRPNDSNKKSWLYHSSHLVKAGRGLIHEWFLRERGAGGGWLFVWQVRVSRRWGNAAHVFQVRLVICLEFLDRLAARLIDGLRVRVENAGPRVTQYLSHEQI
jgi:hypothetical protein